MANHKSALKRIRQSEKRRLRNRYYHKTARTTVKVLRNEENKAAARAIAESNLFIRQISKEEYYSQKQAANLKAS